MLLQDRNGTYDLPCHGTNYLSLPKLRQDFLDLYHHVYSQYDQILLLQGQDAKESERFEKCRGSGLPDRQRHETLPTGNTH